MDKEDLEALLATTVEQDGSTFLLAAGHRPAMRKAGKLVRLDDDIATRDSLDNLSREFLFADHRELLEKGRDVEFLYASQRGTRFRTVVMRQAKGLRMAFHRIPTDIPTFDELELPVRLAGFATLNSGLIAVTGFLGSGKRTTLAAMINYINETRSKHVVLIESPIEFIHDSKRSLIHQREVGFHVRSYAAGVREACRSGADVIVVGEVKNAETMDAILDATEKGALVFTTVNASSVAAGLVELQSFYNPEDRPRMRARAAAALRVMMAQTLIDHVDGQRKVPLLEIMINSSAISRVIQSGEFRKLEEAMINSRGLGSQTGDMGLRELLSRGVISQDDALFHADDMDTVLAGQESLSRR